MSNLTLTGILKVKKSESIVNDKFKKLEFVVTDTASQYPQHVSLQLTQDRTSLLDNVNEGDKITVSFNLRGREWTSPQGEVKYFNTLDIEGFSRMMKDPSFCYKFYWLEVIVQLISANKTQAAYDEIINEMIA